MAITVAAFRDDYPEFGSAVFYPDSGVAYWLRLAYLFLNAARWDTLLDLGAELFVAHNLALEKRAADEAAAGSAPGRTTGPLSSSSVANASASYDTGSAIEEGAGHWNLTVYGIRFIDLVRMMGAGPIQVGVGTPFYAQGPFLPSGLAWAGPYAAPGWFGS
jgi:hypothetical protein